MNNKPAKKDHGGIRIEISRRALADIIDSKLLSISDIHCLDPTSKQRVWQTCLESTIKDYR